MKNAYRIRLIKGTAGLHVWYVWHNTKLIGTGASYHSYAAQEAALACIQSGGMERYPQGWATTA